MRSPKLLIGAAALTALAARRAYGARAQQPPAGGDVNHLREELRRELDRLAGADIKASRSRREATGPPG